MADFRLGIDLGGTKIEIVALAPDGSERTRRRVETPRTHPATVEAITRLVAEVEEELGGTGSVGIGIPGTISPVKGLVINANSTWLIGHPFDRDLADSLGRPVRLMNDANCFALSEAADGAAAGAHTVFGVILGTGVGGGVVVDGRALEGHQRIGGEWGHNPLPWPTDDETPGPSCYCGKRGCMETFVSGPGMVHDHQVRTGERLDTADIAASAQAGDSPAIETIDLYVDRLARGLATVVNVVDPEVIVLGGGMSNLPDLAERVQAGLPSYVFTDEPRTRVVRNVHGDSSGVRGAAWLWAVEG